MQDTNAIRKFLKVLAILRQINALRRSSDDSHAILLQSSRKIQRCLATKLNNGPNTLLAPINTEDILKCDRLEIQTIARVIIRRHRLGVAVDHHRLEACVAQRIRRMYTAVVKFDSLTDAIRATTDNHYLWFVRGGNFAITAIRRIIVRRRRFEFGGTSIHQTIRRMQPQTLTACTHVILRRVQQHSNLLVTVAELFGLQKQRLIGGKPGKRLHSTNLIFIRDEFLKLRQEPRVNRRECMHTVDTPPTPKCLMQFVNPFGRWNTQTLFQSGLRQLDCFQTLPVATETTASCFETPQRLLESLFERPTNRHRLSNTFHLCA